MSKNIISIILMISLAIMSVSFSSAQITLTGLNETYSLGDELKIGMSVTESSAIDGIIGITLKCDSYEAPFFMTSVKLNANEEKSFTIEPLKLTQQGLCNLRAELKKMNVIVDGTDSGQFEISNEIIITLQILKTRLNPGEKIVISGNAEKANKRPFNGAGTIKFNDRSYNLVVKGRFSYDVAIDSQIKSGKNILSIIINDEEGNSGIIDKDIYINAIPTKLSIDLDKETFNPNETISASIALYDQANDLMNDSISVTIYNPWGLDLKSEVLNGDEFDFELSNDAVPGNWWIYAYSNGIKERKFFYVEEVEKIDVEIVNQTLKVRNIGNVVYQKPIEIFFSSENRTKSQVIELELPVNKEEIFNLHAPDGDYDITVKGTDVDKSFNAILTGKAISVNSTNAFTNRTKEIIVIAFVLLVIVFAIFSRFKSGKKINVRLRDY
jgi:hypothetical protein